LVMSDPSTTSFYRTLALEKYPIKAIYFGANQ
jgi:hypothetical protein